MARIPVDLRNVEAAGDFPIFPDGDYTLSVKDVEQGTSNSGKPKLQVKFEIVDGPDGSGDYTGKTMVRSYSLVEAALPFLRRFVEACGLDGDDLNSVDDELLIGAKIGARVSTKEYNGKLSNDIGGERALNGAGAPAPAGLQTP